ncbi:cytochrome b5-like [Sitodiplosis mosellana]|uniref:cytochrome b5-like n=1 Tax=Sitodiplosis mosellana TaxID=263140 RepID=UPI00244399EA|nr:cytochrome b5-like [Sitodiplosis mosellana]
MSELHYTYTLEEIKCHNGKNGAKTWVVIHDMVYDVSDYLKDHPGGDELILDVAGRDCTKDFDDFGHSSDAKKILAKLKVGELVEDDKRSNRKKEIEKGEKKEKNDKNKNDDEVVKRRRKFRFFFCA